MTAFYSFLMVVSLALCQQPNQSPFKIVISTEKSTVVAGSEVAVDVGLTNTSNQEVYEGVMFIDSTGLDSTLRFEVRDEHGKMVPKRTYAHPEVATGSVKFRTISVGQTLTQHQLVSALYDLRKPGKYAIQAFRRISDNPNDDIKSNIVTITLTPKDKVPASKNGKGR
jgi:hypothetical protein